MELLILVTSFLAGWVMRGAFIQHPHPVSPASRLIEAIGHQPRPAAAEPAEPPPWKSHPRWGALDDDAFSFDWTNGKVHVVDDWASASDTVGVDQFADECGITVDELRSRLS